MKKLLSILGLLVASWVVYAAVTPSINVENLGLYGPVDAKVDRFSNTISTNITIPFDGTHVKYLAITTNVTIQLVTTGMAATQPAEVRMIQILLTNVNSATITWTIDSGAILWAATPSTVTSGVFEFSYFNGFVWGRQAGIASGGTATLSGTNTVDEIQANRVVVTNDVTAATVIGMKAFQSYQTNLTHAGSMALDFDAAVTVASITCTGNLTCTFSNLATNRTYRLKIEQPKATNCTLTLPAGTQGYYTTTLSNGWHMLSFEAWGANATNVWASASSNGTY